MNQNITTIKYPARSQWQQLMTRAVLNTDELQTVVGDIVAEVRRRGDEALRDYARRFDGVELADLRVSEAEIAEAAQLVSEELKQAIATAAANIERFHSAQVMQPIAVETVPGVRCEQRAVAISNVGLYIPGGNSPLFSTVLMLVIPARIAGCRHIVLCTPPGKNGKVHPAILYAAQYAGATEIYKVGGAQAIAAMAFGTESIPKVDKIVGSSLVPDGDITKLQGLANIKSVASGELQISETGELGVSAIDASKVTGLSESLNGKISGVKVNGVELIPDA